MLAIIGTVPDPSVPILEGKAEMAQHRIFVKGHAFPIHRGTPALLAAAIQTCRVLGQPSPIAYLVGDIGLGEGSRRLYEYITKNIAKTNFDVLVFHYLQPDVDWHNRMLFAIEEMARTPLLIADAGSMYVAKMSGQAEIYDLFTPDIGELAFLADEKAPHPFYTRGFILHMEDQVPEMIDRAYEFQNAAKCLLVKGREDYVADHQGILAKINSPNVAALEPIGGTGDTLTGVTAALVDSGMSIKNAAESAAKINRLAGYYAQPSPATQVTELIDHIPSAINEVMKR